MQRILCSMARDNRQTVKLSVVSVVESSTYNPPKKLRGFVILLMEEIPNNHLFHAWNPANTGDIYHINWCNHFFHQQYVPGFTPQQVDEKPIISRPLKVRAQQLTQEGTWTSQASTVVSPGKFSRLGEHSRYESFKDFGGCWNSTSFFFWKIPPFLAGKIFFLPILCDLLVVEVTSNDRGIKLGHGGWIMLGEFSCHQSLPQKHQLTSKNPWKSLQVYHSSYKLVSEFHGFTS